MRLLRIGLSLVSRVEVEGYQVRVIHRLFYYDFRCILNDNIGIINRRRLLSSWHIGFGLKFASFGESEGVGDRGIFDIFTFDIFFIDVTSYIGVGGSPVRLSC